MLITVITITVFVALTGIHIGTIKRVRMESIELSLASEFLLGILFPIVLISSTGDSIRMLFSKDMNPLSGYTPIKKYPITISHFIEIVKMEIDNYKYEGFSEGLKLKKGEVHFRPIFIIEIAIKELDFKLFK